MVAILRLAAVALIAAAAPPAAAMADDATGFGVDPAPPYKAERSSHPQHDVIFAVDSTTGTPAIAGRNPHLCGAGLKKMPTYAGHSQAEVNGVLDDKVWRDQARALVAANGTITSETEFKLHEARGIEFVFYPKSGPGADNVATMLSIVETPNGRVSLVCGTTRAELEQTLASFRAIRSTITLPTRGAP